MSDQTQERIQQLEHDVVNLRQVLVIMNEDIIPKLQQNVKLQQSALLELLKLLKEREDSRFRGNA